MGSVITFGALDDGVEQFEQFLAVVVDRGKCGIVDIPAIVEQAKPVAGLSGFFVGDPHARREVLFRETTNYFLHIGPDRGPAPEHLLRKDELPLFQGKVLVHPYDADGKRVRFLLHHIPSFRRTTPGITHCTHY